MKPPRAGGPTAEYLALVTAIALATPLLQVTPTADDADPLWTCYCRGQREDDKYITGVGQGKTEKEAKENGKEDVQRKAFSPPGRYVRHIKCRCYKDR